MQQTALEAGVNRVCWRLLALGLSAASVTQAGDLIEQALKGGAREAYDTEYSPAKPHKAFAVSASNHFGWSSNRESEVKAAQAALYNCLRASLRNCTLYALDDQSVFEAFRTAAEASAKALSTIQAPPARAYADEDKDAGVPPPTGLKLGNMHEPTPESVDFAQTLSTRDLVAMLYGAKKPVVIDVLQPTEQDFRKAVLPSAFWISGAGAPNDSGDRRVDELLAKVMADVSPDKTAPVVVYCLSWQCWLSYNALFRLSRLGYINLYWYRGGIEAWQRAQLPTIRTPLYAQVN